MPIWARSRPAASSMLVSAWLRGAGPPNRASIACCWASPALRPAVPATGGVRLKSGGMINGALRATANSSGVPLRLLNKEQPLVATAATKRAAVRVLRMFDRLLGAGPLSLLLTGQERAQQQYHDADANRSIADIEYQKRAAHTVYEAQTQIWRYTAKVQVGEVDDIAEPDAVEDVAERATEHHPERDLVGAVLLTPDPERDPERDRTRQRDQHPAADRVASVEQAERNALVLRVGQVEDRQQHQLVAEIGDLKRPGDQPFDELVEREDDRGDGEAELAGLYQNLPRTGEGAQPNIVEGPRRPPSIPSSASCR